MEIIAIIALVLAIIAIIIIIIVSLVGLKHKNAVLTNGVAWIVQKGTQTNNVDTMTTTGHCLYLGISTAAVALTIAPNSNTATGNEIGIKNNSTETITLVPGTGVSIDQGQLNLTVGSGDFAILMTIGANAYVRLQ